MKTSGTESRPPSHAQPTQAKGDAALAEQMRDKAATGELLDRGEGSFDLAAMKL